MREILGQERPIAVLETAVASERAHHAYIFHGQAGVGKFTTARAFAKLLLCLSRQTDLTGRLEACDSCESCRLMAAGSHPDFQIIAKELAAYSSDKRIRDRKQLTIPVDVLREHLLERAYHGAKVGSNKVFIVDEAELMDQRGQNLLLKTLEEPPAGTFIILVTSSEHRLLITVRSRCQRVSFVPLSQELIAQHLSRREQDEGLELTEPQRKWLVRFAAGSLGRLDVALRFNLWNWARQVIAGLDAMERGRAPAELGQQMAQMIDSFATDWVAHHGDQTSKEAANKQAAGLLWAMIGQQAQQRLAAAAREQEGREPWEAEAAVQPWLALIDVLRQAEGELAANVNAGIVTDHLVSMMHRALLPLAGAR